MTDKYPNQHDHQRVGPTTSLIKLLVDQQLLKLGRLVYYTAIIMSMTNKYPNQHDYQRVGPTTPLIKLLVVQ